MIERTITLVYESHGWNNAKQCDVYIEPEELADYSIYDVRKGLNLYKLGYEKSITALNDERFKFLM